ncbi:Mu transposase domain-containing protein [Bradyrhizobium arachidis]|uniref:Mu transposase domain-containing protein n=1 Tax=Bradyrhizobium arachidis TaxID=858423 RepID=UPI0038D0ECF8
MPPTHYHYADGKKCRVVPDYHVEIASHYYSVPSRLIREELEANITDRRSRSCTRASELPAIPAVKCPHRTP